MKVVLVSSGSYSVEFVMASAALVSVLGHLVEDSSQRNHLNCNWRASSSEQRTPWLPLTAPLT